VPSADLDRASTVTVQPVAGTNRYIPISSHASLVNIANRTIPSYISASPQVLALLDSLERKRPSSSTVTVGQTEMNPI
jgi:hypothetical protein